ncbi:hypothetical protein SCUCBS95973_000560 [Sporothrix curviconia]|uniref:SET domain-containing protein n=1 Tax=Sporothrix curviconia TaxID=1260050 RepID=A0ABP0ARC4_9PEZI
MPSHSPGPSILHVQRQTPKDAKDVYNGNDLDGPRMCRNTGHGDDTLLRVFGSQCLRPLPLLDVQDIPGKGLGVVARQAIPRGSVLLLDEARVLADVRFPQHIRRAQGQTLLHKAVGRLPEPDDVRGLSRSAMAQPGEARGVLEENVLSTNSFAVTFDGVAYMALFPEIARINHACNPTALTRFNDKDLTQKVIAFCDIEPGEEVTISYTDFGLSHDARQEKLLRRWGFRCTCNLCSGGANAAAASDARRRRVTDLRNEVVAHLQKGAFILAISAYEDELLDLVRIEHLAEHMGEHYEVLARLHLAAGNHTAAGAYAQRALDELETFGLAGTQSSAGSVHELRAFVKAFTSQEQRAKDKKNKRDRAHAEREKREANSQKETAKKKVG